MPHRAPAQVLGRGLHVDHHQAPRVGQVLQQGGHRGVRGAQAALLGMGRGAHGQQAQAVRAGHPVPVQHLLDRLGEPGAADPAGHQGGRQRARFTCPGRQADRHRQVRVGVGVHGDHRTAVPRAEPGQRGAQGRLAGAALARDRQSQRTAGRAGGPGRA